MSLACYSFCLPSKFFFFLAQPHSFSRFRAGYLLCLLEKNVKNSFSPFPELRSVALLCNLPGNFYSLRAPITHVQSFKVLQTILHPLLYWSAVASLLTFILHHSSTKEEARVSDAQRWPQCEAQGPARSGATRVLRNASMNR